MSYSQFLIDNSFDIDFVIYRFKNKVNGKVYIGQTIKPFRKRVIQHMTNSRPTTKCRKSYFHNALNKYGFEKFDVSIIERCSSQQELDERERYWIAYYNATDKKYGYNIDSGGSMGKRTKPLSAEHKQKLLDANLGKHRSEETKLRLSNINKEKWKGSEFRETRLKQIKCIGWNKKSVYQYDLNGNFIKEWECGYDVCEYLYGSRRKGNLKRNITLNIKKNKLGFTKKGFIWSYVSPSERRAY